MPSEVAAVLLDMHRHIGLAKQFVAGFDFESFRNDERTIFAVIRCLEVVSEASRRLPEDLKARHPNLPWKSIAGAGNVFRQDYEDVAPKIVWDTVQLALPPLEQVITAELARTQSEHEPS
jgi:uncharacterized protein with HEPN domain